ncbi:methyltransferase, FxLD system [Streptomyces flavofungini]|uniref:Protein-L-isoaspartate O-methyltransferase n=1 Tax=Streptomyces flavofungini TaxID=68200 RepID=A0ABS0X7Q2_9ACTN|nr:methyltransferase, FxLD system [Streptomyces flavofungini]MBJ3809227.1 methyltransferase, FxLD system [Streptomyces flavofungini]GHC77027.1 O-methyltransferase [Streptomyces flavofungini]
MAAAEWPQRVIQFTDWDRSEITAVEHLLPLLATHGAELSQWSFLRKSPSWRVRFRPAGPEAAKRLDMALDELVAAGVLASWTRGIYEPEEAAFGGPSAMEIAHVLFHHDSGHLLHQLAREQALGSPGLGRRELGILLLSVMMRAAGLDWYEQGDVWARIAAERPGDGVRHPQQHMVAVHRLMTVDVSLTSSGVTQSRLASVGDWIATFERFGQQLADLSRQGLLDRGMRAVIAHHGIFHWNRLGLPAGDQHTLSTLAKEVVMGTSDNAASTPTEGPQSTTVGEVNSDILNASSADRLRTQLIDDLVKEGCVRTPRVEAAMRTVPRHLFVPNAPLEKAYGNAPVNTKLDESGASISCASQPDVVAMMLEQLEVEPDQKVLELGAGTGFNAGLLGHLVGEKGHVTTIDVDDDIVDGARAGLAAADIHNVEVILGDGAVGHAPNAPYDRIVATVGAHGVPHAWLDQLAPGGRLLTPLRLRGSVSRSIAFECQEGVWRSVGSEMNTFMPLRRGIADDPRLLVPLAPGNTVTLVTNGDQTVDADALSDVLRQPRVEVWTGVNFRGPESAEYLELWLTCTMPNGLSRMPARPEAIDRGLLIAPYPSSTAAFEGATLTYLTRRPAAEKAPDGATLYEFGVIGHGVDGEALAGNVADQIRTWDRAFRDHDVAFEIHPLNAVSLTPKPGRFAFDNALNRIVIEWK